MFNYITQYRNKRFYAQFIGANDLCFDIGANIGKKSQLFLSIGAKVIAFEPQSSCYRPLQKLKKKHLKFDFYPYAVGAQKGEVDLFLANHSEVATLSKKFIDYFTCDTIYWNKNEKVTVTTLDHLMEKFGLPHYCKIDTEGYEADILLHLNSKIPMIEFEFTGGFIPETLAIIKYLNAKNVTFNYVLNEHLKFKQKEWITAEELTEILKALPKNRLHGNIFVKTYDN